jgi:hypothetical protein
MAERSEWLMLYDSFTYDSPTQSYQRRHCLYVYSKSKCSLFILSCRVLDRLDRWSSQNAEAQLKFLVQPIIDARLIGQSWRPYLLATAMAGIGLALCFRSDAKGPDARGASSEVRVPHTDNVPWRHSLHSRPPAREMNPYQEHHIVGEPRNRTLNHLSIRI